ncbi:MAG: cytochrome c family protein [Betaproteobacteria bacterium]|nr:cytochrome c family protein [Betaproteobacteria bacterium]
MNKLIVGLIVLTGAFATSCAYADGDAARGKKIFEECAACHSLEKGVNAVGPTLHGVFERKAGELTEFRYSPAMKRSALPWSARTMDIFLTDPQQEIKGNRMPYSGIANANDRADLIEYLRTATK